MFVLRYWSNIIFSFVAMLIMIDWLSFFLVAQFSCIFFDTQIFFLLFYLCQVWGFILALASSLLFEWAAFEIHCAQLQWFHILPSLRNESWMIPARSDKAFSKEQRFLHFPYRGYMTISVMGGFYFMSAEFSCEFLFVMCTSLKSSILLL